MSVDHGAEYLLHVQALPKLSEAAVSLDIKAAMVV